MEMSNLWRSLVSSIKSAADSCLDCKRQAAMRAVRGLQSISAWLLPGDGLLQTERLFGLARLHFHYEGAEWIQ